LGYRFRFNEVTDRIEVNGEPITDVLQAQIRAQMRDKRHKSMSAIEDAYTAEAWRNRYHPVRDYFAGLQWDGQPNIDKLASHFTDRHGVFPLYLRRWLIGAVAKLYERDARNFMLVLDGAQYIGKSRFVRWLCPLDGYFFEGPLNTDDKDTWIRLTSIFVWELSELDATTKKADRAALKDFVTRHDVTIRRPYAKHDVIKPALASLIGSINEEGPGFLNDPTGNTRFAVVNLTEIDFGYTALDLDQIWAEAYTAYQAGEQWELTPFERQQQAEINAEYESEPTIDGMIYKYYNLDPALDEWTPGIDIILNLEFYGLKDNQRGSLMELARFMKKAGHERRRIRRVWCYKGVTQKTAGVVI
jgi:putative DNA primase/helicase